MKKLALLFVGAVIAGSGTAALADATLTVPGVGSAEVNGAGYIIVLDGSSDNPVADGYIGVSHTPELVCGASGGPFNDDGTNSDAYGAIGCDPTSLAPAPPA
ncbi:MAG TPA: hypothetical protein VNB24_07550 [Acidimicrobiales bacterium]|nr:hypothetical protein [Acidimicrobiales bacterium]